MESPLGIRRRGSYKLGIPIRLAFGVFWHQCLSNLMQDCIDDGLDWLLFLDYDSIFSAEQLSRLLTVFGSNPHIDALAALQCRRGVENVPLLSNGQSETEITGEPIKVNTAHFGMTLMRVDALKRFPMPWFVGVPDKDGSYRTLGRIDPDIWFWHRWKDAGNSLYVDPLCSIGHLQVMCSAFSDELKVEHLHPESGVAHEKHWRGYAGKS